MIYYRCADKRCPARIHVTATSRKLELKNEHLSHREHKSASSRSALTLEQLLVLPDIKRRSAVIVPKQPRQPPLAIKATTLRGPFKRLRFAGGNFEQIRCVGKELAQRLLLQSVYLFDGRTGHNEKVAFVDFNYFEQNETVLLAELRRLLPDQSNFSISKLTPRFPSDFSQR